MSIPLNLTISTSGESTLFLPYAFFPYQLQYTTLMNNSKERGNSSTLSPKIPTACNPNLCYLGLLQPNVPPYSLRGAPHPLSISVLRLASYFSITSWLPLIAASFLCTVADDGCS